MGVGDAGLPRLAHNWGRGHDRTLEQVLPTQWVGIAELAAAQFGDELIDNTRS